MLDFWDMLIIESNLIFDIGIRRPAHQIKRHYECPISQCGKAYGSEGSLNQHVKLKHREYYDMHGKSSSRK